MMTDIWYLLRYKPQQELRAIENIQRQGITCFSPWISVSKIRAGARVIQREPFFPGYLFIRADMPINWMAVAATRGVLEIVNMGRGPVVATAEDIESIRQMAAKIDAAAGNLGGLKQGAAIQISGGLFAGQEGVYFKDSGQERSIVLLNALQGRTRVRIENRFLEAV